MVTIEASSPGLRASEQRLVGVSTTPPLLKDWLCLPGVKQGVVCNIKSVHIHKYIVQHPSSFVAFVFPVICIIFSKKSVRFFTMWEVENDYLSIYLLVYLAIYI